MNVIRVRWSLVGLYLVLAVFGGVGAPGSRAVAAAAPSRTVSLDFDGDRRADVMVYRPRTGDWWVRRSDGTSHTRLAWGGTTGDLPAPGDYNGDGVMDPTIFRPRTGTWYMRDIGTVTWGAVGDVPVAADYNGDGTTDVAVYRPANGIWYIRGIAVVAWGEPHDLPVPADYNGDGITEIAVFRPSTGVWYIRGLMTVTYGVLADMPVPADYNGDGVADIAVFRPSTGHWFVKDQFITVWGQQGDVPVPLDRDGDGRVEIGVYRRGTGLWYFKDVLAWRSEAIAWGEPGDVPIGRGMFPWHSAFGRVDKDFDRDGRDDLVLYRQFSGEWLIRHTDGSSDERVLWWAGPAAFTALPVPGDYNGDGLTDLAVFDQHTGRWHIRGVGVIQWGERGDVPVPGDYDGDGLTDIAVYRRSNGMWYVRGIGVASYSGVTPLAADFDGDGITDLGMDTGAILSVRFVDLRGASSFGTMTAGLPAGGCLGVVPADYDGDGKSDYARYLCEGTWQMADQREIQWLPPLVLPTNWGHIPNPLDRDGDGRAELGVFQPRDGSWRFKNLVTGATESVAWGVPFSQGEIPVGANLASYLLIIQ